MTVRTKKLLGGNFTRTVFKRASMKMFIGFSRMHSKCSASPVSKRSEAFTVFFAATGSVYLSAIDMEKACCNIYTRITDTIMLCNFIHVPTSADPLQVRTRLII